MDPETWRQAKDVLADALKLPPADRVALVEARCPDSQVRAEVLHLLDQDSTSFLEDPPAIADLLEEELPIGTRIGDYVIVDELGQGGMGRVYLGRDVTLHRKVALKSLVPRGSGSTGGRARIVREARAAAQINHPNVATIHNVVEDGKRAFIVMEYVEGESLAAVIRRERLPIDRAIAIGRQLARALAAAHAKGVVHRDVKPANVQITADGTVKLLDFGVAGVTPAFTTVTGPVTRGESKGPQPGTRGYMSPEQMLSREVTERSDIFSLGVVIFEMVTGERAFPKTDPIDLIDAVIRPLRRADEVNPKVPRALADIVAKAVAVDPAARYQSAASLAASLDALAPVKWTMPWVLLAAVIIVPIVVWLGLVGVGYLSSRAFDIMLDRAGFANESVLDWLSWGWRSCFAPGVMTMLALLVVSLALVARKLILTASMRTRVQETSMREWLGRRSAALHFDDLSVVASWLLLATAVPLVWSWIHFGTLIDAVFSHAKDASYAQFALLSTDGPRDAYRQTLTILLILSVVCWSQLVRVVLKTGRSVNRWLITGGVVVVALAVVTLQLPYRLLYQAQFPIVRWQDEACGIIGSRGTDQLLFCPGMAANNRHHVVRADAAGPASVPANIFDLAAKSDPNPPRLAR